MPNMTQEKNVERVVRGGVACYRVPKFADGKAVLHAFSTRRGGVSQGVQDSLNLSYKTGDDPLRVSRNRDFLARALGIGQDQFVIAEQVHGDTVLEAGKKDRGRSREPGGYLGKGDALVTKERGLAIMVLVADCLPVLFHDPVNKAVGAAHAGWRGTLSHTPVKTLIRMGEIYGTNASEAKAVLGPCIGPCCYEVGDQVRKEFMDVFPWAEDVFKQGFSGNWMLDLPEANARQLLDIGVKPENLIRTGLCTIDHIGDFYSHRTESTQGRSTGRIGAVIMLKQQNVPINTSR
jgi:YfiH family protein